MADNKQSWRRAFASNPWIRIGVPFLSSFSTALLWPIARGRASYGVDPGMVFLVVISAVAVAIGIAECIRDRNGADKARERLRRATRGE